MAGCPRSSRSSLCCLVAATTLAVAFSTGCSADPAPDDNAADEVGPWIAYQTDRVAGRDSVWLVRPDGTEDHQLETGLPYENLLPDWSPDGSQLAFTTRGGTTEPLYEYDMETQETEQLFECESPCLGDDEPAYSPDGGTLAFIRYLEPFVGGAPSDCGIWLGDRVTGEVRQLTSNTDPACDREYYPRWSPDGDHLVYQRELTVGGDVRTAVFTMRADGSGERRLTEPAMMAGEPAYSPDGEWIVFSTHPLNLETGGRSQLYRMRPDGGGREKLTDGEARATQPRYSPDGEWILFTSVTPSSRTLAMIPADGGDPVTVADEEPVYTHGQWQPVP